MEQKKRFPRFLKITLITICGLFVLFVIIGLCLDHFSPGWQASVQRQDSIDNVRAKYDDSIKAEAEAAQRREDATMAAAEKQKQQQKEQAEKGIDAYLMSQDFLMKKLKSPATAKFPTYQEHFSTYLVDGVYEVRSYVDAQNSFGALLRGNYYCKLKYVGNDEWQCLNIDFQEPE